MSQERARLPDRRPSYLDRFSFGEPGKEVQYEIGIGLDPASHAVREIFLTGTKVGSDTEAVLADVAVVVSLLLQHGPSVDDIRKALSRTGTFREDPQTARRASFLGAALDRVAEIHPEIVAELSAGGLE